MEADNRRWKENWKKLMQSPRLKKEELSNIESNIDTTEEDVADVEEDLNNENQILADLEAAEAEAQRQYEALEGAAGGRSTESERRS